MSLTGKSLVAIGGTNGIGRAISRHAAHLGANVTVIGRQFRDADVPRMQFVPADLSLLSTAAALGDSLPSDADVYLFTNAISPPRDLARTDEAIELHAAVSLLSRLALLRALLPRIHKNCRIFIMSALGEDHAASPSTLNPSAPPAYSPLQQNANVASGNEALVLYCRSALEQPARTLLSGSDASVHVFGLNPGVISTDLRKTFLGDNLWSNFLEVCVSAVCISAADYACNFAVPLMFAPDLLESSGILFNQSGHAILPSPSLTPQRADAMIDASNALIDAVVKPPPPALPKSSWQHLTAIECTADAGFCSWCMEDRKK
jgi:NAD(P)-dependent dehydrogenase (short-subunit alcohol dehydrogenase family)